MDLGQSIRSGVKWLFLGSVGGRLLEFGFGIALARLLVPADFGLIVTIHVFTGVAGLVLSGGMGQSLIRAKEADQSDFNAVFTLQLSVGVLVYLVFFLAAPLMSQFFDDARYEDLLRVSAISFLLRPFSLIRNAWLNREMEFKKRTLVALVTGLCTGVSGVLMAWSGMGVWSLVLSGLVGALVSNITLKLVTPMKLRLTLNFTVMRRHSSFGFKITVNNLLSYLSRESKNLVLSKLAGPVFLGIFNKAESLARTPNALMVPATMQPVFRAMSKVQDDLNETKYIFYRSITLLTVYTTPCYVGLWWVAGPFIEVVYGEKWLMVIEPLRIYAIAGLFFNVMFPCGKLLDAQNRLIQQMVVLAARLVIVIAACVVGLRWGLEGVAWGVVLSHVINTVAVYYLVCRTIATRIADLFNALLPGLMLNAMLFSFLTVMHYVLTSVNAITPAIYLLLMSLAGAAFYGMIFLFTPIPSIRSEADRWRNKLRSFLGPRYGALD